METNAPRNSASVRAASVTFTKTVRYLSRQMFVTEESDKCVLMLAVRQSQLITSYRVKG